MSEEIADIGLVAWLKANNPHTITEPTNEIGREFDRVLRQLFRETKSDEQKSN